MTADTFTPHLGWQAGTIDAREAELGEEIGLIRQAKKSLKSEVFGGYQTGVDQRAADALTVRCFGHREGLQLADGVGVDVHGSTADQAADFGLGDQEVADILV